MLYAISKKLRWGHRISKTRRQKLKVSRVNLLPNGLTYETFFSCCWHFPRSHRVRKMQHNLQNIPNYYENYVFSHQIRFSFPSSQRDKIFSRVSSLTILQYIDRVELILVLVCFILRIGENSGFSPCNFKA